ncbi:MAG: aspartate--tRNA ligase [Abitibacteriaceae bacterium]|nr:aspartate--tRNA ligase [Abditibacteriaceae bacterium]
MKRTHSCGTLSEANIGQEVTLCGWVNVVRDQSHQTFLDLRDRSGLVQCVADRDNNAAVYAALEGIKAEYCLQLTGSVQARLPGKENPKLATGSIEVQLSGVEVLNTSKTLPFEIVDDLKTDENVRIQYRYLDLRRRPMQYNLETRHRIVKKTRDFLDGEGFWEVETPLLWKSTPEGAKEFMVPATAQPGKSFVLPQSPQISKQLLMVGGVEKYFQIARCFRDEAARADRFLEFTQIDIEMSFVSQDDVLDVTERLLAYLMREVKGQELPLPLPRLTYAEAIRRYGSDKPDTRFGMEFVDISDLAVGSGFKVFANAVASGGQVKAICAPGCADYSRKDIEDLTNLVKRFGARGLATFALGESEIKSQVAKFFSDEQMQEIFRRCEAKTGDLVLCVADHSNVVAQSLDFLRRELGQRLNLIEPGTFNFLWIVDTPMFEFNPETGHFDAMHHPFCLPNPEDLPLLEEGFTSPLPHGDPMHPWARVRSWLYDIVLNGYEIGSGSIRCHRRDIQEKIFRIIGLPPEESQRRFGFMLDAFEYGAPPHGGIAPGLDRLVMLLAEVPDNNMRDIVAFPKTTSGTDPMSGAPTPIDEKRLHELGLAMLPEEAANNEQANHVQPAPAS